MDVKSWTNQTVIEWIQKNGFGDFVVKFKYFNGQSLLDLKDYNVLVELGIPIEAAVPLFGHINNLKLPSSQAPVINFFDYLNNWINTQVPTETTDDSLDEIEFEKFDSKK